MLIEKRVFLRSRLLCLVPFGVPQLVRGDNLKGWLLFAGQTAALGVNVVAFWRFRALQREDDGTFDDVAGAKAWRAVQFTAFGLAAGLALYGIIDAFIHLRPRTSFLVPRLGEQRPGSASARSVGILGFEPWAGLRSAGLAWRTLF